MVVLEDRISTLIGIKSISEETSRCLQAQDKTKTGLHKAEHSSLLYERLEIGCIILDQSGKLAHELGGSFGRIMRR